ncbi:MAG: hypothetical protein GY852_09325 [bacterium]|nr:hypothetical protein [bacterium]
MMFGNNDQNGSNPMGGGMGMPGPAMASRMMQMMPMMAGGMLSEMSGEDRKTYLLEMVSNLVAKSTSDMPDTEYSTLVEELSSLLRKRETPESETKQSCC